MTGLFKQTSGLGFVNGFNISGEMREVYEGLGICPQFDVVWPSLTVLEHLCFYARLKGVKGDPTEFAFRTAADVQHACSLKRVSHLASYERIISWAFGKHHVNVFQNVVFF